MTERLLGKTALVTGGGSGIGRATALAFASEGAKVAVADINVTGGEETLRLIRDAGGEAIFVRTDVSEAADVEAMVNKTVETFGRLDCAFNNCAQMLEQGSGAIVNTSSIWGLVGAAGVSGYVASKHAVVGLTRAAALEDAKQGIRVNAVNPGTIRTPLLEPLAAVSAESETALIAMHPAGRLGQPQEVAEAVVWLCSDAPSFVTGHTLAVDGGYTAQ